MAQICAKPGCNESAVALLSYDYATSRVTLGPIVDSPAGDHPMCAPHADRLTPPVGWELADTRERRRVLLAVEPMGEA